MVIPRLGTVLTVLGVGAVVGLGVLALLNAKAGGGEPVKLTPPSEGGSTQQVVEGTPFIATPGPTPTDAPVRTPTPRDLEIITILSKDAIPAILDPTFITREKADGRFIPQELVLGLSINGDHRAYSTTYLSSREIVNDVVGGVPVAVTW